MLFYLCLVRLDGVDARHDETFLRVGQRVGDGSIGRWIDCQNHWTKTDQDRISDLKVRNFDTM